MDINKVLHDIQQKLKAPKNQYNSFGDYNYRSCEDILEAVKKLLPDGVVLTLTDVIEEHGGRVFVVSEACLSGDCDKDRPYVNVVRSSGCAEVAKEQKGMQAAQITGSASSYARKYALNGIFCIDDAKDNDSDEDKKERDEQEKKELERKHKETSEKWENWTTTQLEKLETIDEHEEIDRWYEDNKGYIASLEKHSRSLHKDLMDKYVSLNTTLLDNQNG